MLDLRGYLNSHDIQSQRVPCLSKNNSCILKFWVKSSATSVFTQVGSNILPSYDTIFSLLLKHNSYIMLHPNWVDIPSEPSMQTIALFWDPCHPHGWQWAILPGSIISPVTSKKIPRKKWGVSELGWCPSSIITLLYGNNGILRPQHIVKL